MYYYYTFLRTSGVWNTPLKVGEVYVLSVIKHSIQTVAASGVAHTCSSLLRDNGEAVFALAFGHGGDGGLLIVKLPVTGSAVTTLLKRESTVPRFLSGLTGALR